MVTFTARRSTPELVAPARPTPHELKTLSDIDDSKALRYYQPFVEFFRRRRRGPAVDAVDPAKAIRAALAEALVHYYPMAGCLRKLPGGKLAVDCTGEGVVFVEADADVRLDELGHSVVEPPFSGREEFMCDVGDSGDVLGKPLFFLQVTRLKCGGFVTGFHTCHNMADGFGMIQFMKAITDIAHTDQLPIVKPVWERELLMARDPPCITHMCPAYGSLLSDAPEEDGDSITGSGDIILSTPPEAFVGRFFFFTAADVAALRAHIPKHLAKSTSTFEIVTAATWRCRTAALGYQKTQRVRLLFTVNARARCSSGVLPIPQGYFGNALFYPLVDCTVDELCGKPLEHAVGLVHNAKVDMAEKEEQMRSMVDVMAMLRELPPVAMERTHIVSDTRWIGEENLDFGWAERVSGGIPSPMLVGSMGMSEYMMCKNADGDDSTVVPMYLPGPAMDCFVKEIDRLLNRLE
uniref:Uncharacterized protein n=1 Tax=Leersia perrieri TaxID=77586 RepID=A0A0D9WY55_9ORYZ